MLKAQEVPKDVGEHSPASRPARKAAYLLAKVPAVSLETYTAWGWEDGVTTISAAGVDASGHPDVQERQRPHTRDPLEGPQNGGFSSSVCQTADTAP